MRVAGAALSVSITNTLRPILLLIYAVFINRSTLKCWPSREEIHQSFNKDWKILVKLSIPSAVMTLSEWLCFEALTFCISYIGTASLAAQTYLATIGTLLWHIPFSASIACSTRLGQLIGSGRTDKIVGLMKCYALVFIAIGLMDCALQTGLTLLMLEFLVHDAEVANIVKTTLPYAATFVIFDSFTNWPHSIVRGLGWQSLGAWVTVLANYPFALPLSLFLELGPPDLGIRGLWIGLGSGLIVIDVFETLGIWLRLKSDIVVRAVTNDEQQDEEALAD